MKCKNLLALLSTFTPFISISHAGPETIEIWPNGVPGQIKDNGGEKNKGWVRNIHTPTLTIYLPKKESANGAGAIICPGGGYGGLAMDHEGHAIAQWLNKEGIAGFVLKYRHAPYKHPIPLQDAQRAIRIVRTNASKYKVNPDKIGIIGSSAGGHLASTVSTHFEKGTPQAKDSHNRVGTRPNFAILLYPVISMKPGITHGGSRNNLLGNSPTNELETLLSNDLQVTSRTPPTFTIHATDDRAVPLKNSELFHTALNKAKVPNKLMVIKKGGHGFGLGRKGKESGTWPPVCEKWLTKILANL